MTPIKLIEERLIEISNELKRALNSFPISSEVKKLTEEYNRYFIALQLLDLHSNIDHKFSRLFINRFGKIEYKLSYIKNHVHALELSEKHNKL